MPVTVVTRVLPFNISEEFEVIGTDTIKNGDKKYAFDKVFSHETNETIFDDSCLKIVEKVVDGYNGTFAAYGQSGSGKTHSLLGTTSELGILHLSVKYLLDLISERTDVQYLVKFRAHEVYMESVFDLLNEDNDNKCRMIGENIVDGRESIIQSYDHFLITCAQAQDRRRVGETNLNQKSSRSHAVFELVVESCIADDFTKKQTTNISKLVIVDLAGSENARTMSTSVQTTESKAINLSLLALSRVISNIAESPSIKCHSFRDSILTRVLQSVLTGNSQFLLLCCIRGTGCSETLSTLSFGQKAKRIPIDPKKNSETTNACLPDLLAQISDLKQQLEEERKKDSGSQQRLEDLRKMVLNFNSDQEKPVVSKSKRRHSIAIGASSFVPTFSRPRFSEDGFSLNALVEEEALPDSGRSSRMSDRYCTETRSTSPQSKFCQTESLFVDKKLYEEMVATCDALKGKVLEMESWVAQKRSEIAAKDDELINLQAKYLESENTVEALRKQLEHRKVGEMETNEARLRIEQLLDTVKEAEGKAAKYEWKYSDLKKRGQKMLKEKDEKLKTEMERARNEKAQLDQQFELEKTARLLETSRRERAEEELKQIQKLLENEFEKEKLRSIEIESQFLSQRTENEALYEKIDELTSRGVTHHPSCSNPHHNLLTNRIDILKRHRDILVNNLHKRVEADNTNN